MENEREVEQRGEKFAYEKIKKKGGLTNKNAKNRMFWRRGISMINCDLIP